MTTNEKLHIVNAILANDTHAPESGMVRLVRRDLLTLSGSTLEALWAIISLKTLEAFTTAVNADPQDGSGYTDENPQTEPDACEPNYFA